MSLNSLLETPSRRRPSLPAGPRDDSAGCPTPKFRFIEHPPDELTWLPDHAPNRPPNAVDPIELENRGITQEPPEAPHPKPVKPVQTELWRKQTAHKFSIAAKLREVGQTETADSLDNCHSYYTVAVCCGCNTVKKFPNRCDRFYCPECQPHLALERKRQVEWWTAGLKQPKHVVLTVRNQPTLTGDHVDELRRWFTNLRKRKRYANWTAGFYSLEVTNEGRGWHLHIHVLVEAKWIDSAQLALDWDSVTNHNGRIVKVKDCRQADYLQEVTKYACKGSDLAKWTPPDIATFITAFSGKRTFGVFGTLYAARTEFAEFIATLKEARCVCKCGCSKSKFYSELEWEIAQLDPATPSTAPPGRDEPQLEFPMDTREHYHK